MYKVVLKNRFLDSGYYSKSVLEALILESVNPQYEKRLFIVRYLSSLNYKKNTSSEHVVYKCLSCSAHRTPNLTNPEFQFPQFKVLQE